MTKVAHNDFLFKKSYQSIVENVLSVELDCIFQIDYYVASFFVGDGVPAGS